MTFWHTFFEITIWTAAPTFVVLAPLAVWMWKADTGDAATFPEIMRVLGGNLVTGLYRVNRWLHEETVLATVEPSAVRFLADPPKPVDENVWDLLARFEHYPHDMVSHQRREVA